MSSWKVISSGKSHICLGKGGGMGGLLALALLVAGVGIGASALYRGAEAVLTGQVPVLAAINSALNWGVGIFVVLVAVWFVYTISPLPLIIAAHAHRLNRAEVRRRQEEAAAWRAEQAELAAAQAERDALIDAAIDRLQAQPDPVDDGGDVIDAVSRFRPLGVFQVDRSGEGAS